MFLVKVGIIKFNNYRNQFEYLWKYSRALQTSVLIFKNIQRKRCLWRNSTLKYVRNIYLLYGNGISEDDVTYPESLGWNSAQGCWGFDLLKPQHTSPSPTRPPENPNTIPHVFSAIIIGLLWYVLCSLNHVNKLIFYSANTEDTQGNKYKYIIEHKIVIL